MTAAGSCSCQRFTTSVSVQIGIKKTGYSTVDIPLSDITLLNRPENQKLVFTPADKITISVKADSSDYAPITAERILAVMDLLECAEPGTYNIPVTITLPDGYSLSDEVVVKVSSSDSESDENAAAAEIRSASGSAADSNSSDSSAGSRGSEGETEGQKE